MKRIVLAFFGIISFGICASLESNADSIKDSTNKINLWNLDSNTTPKSILLAASDISGENTDVILDSIPEIFHSRDADEPPIGSDGFYVINKMGYKFNYLGFSYSLMGYYKKRLFRDKNALLFGRAEVNAGFEWQLTSYTRLGGYIDFQPLSFFGVLVYTAYEGAWTALGRPVLIGPDREYAHAVTGGPKTPTSDMPQTKVGGSTLVTQIMPYLTLGGPVNERKDMIIFVYRPTITIYHAFDVARDTLMYFSGDNVVVKAQGDVHYAHDIMLMYGMDDLGLKVGAVGTLEHIASYKGFWRYGIFGLVIYNKPIKQINKIEPFVAAKIGTWLEDKYFKNNFTILGEVGIRWKL